MAKFCDHSGSGRGDELDRNLIEHCGLMSRILVIDDEADMRAMLEQMLRESGHEVVLAANGKEGVNLFRTKPTDLVITDLFMPVQDGIETILQLRKEFPGVEIIAICGRIAAKPLLLVARQLGAIGILEKPFYAEQLLREVNRVLFRGNSNRGQ